MILSSAVRVKKSRTGCATRYFPGARPRPQKGGFGPRCDDWNLARHPRGRADRTTRRRRSSGRAPTIQTDWYCSRPFTQHCATIPRSPAWRPVEAPRAMGRSPSSKRTSRTSSRAPSLLSTRPPTSCFVASFPTSRPRMRTIFWALGTSYPILRKCPAPQGSESDGARRNRAEAVTGGIAARQLPGRWRRRRCRNARSPVGNERHGLCCQRTGRAVGSPATAPTLSLQGSASFLGSFSESSSPHRPPAAFTALRCRSTPCCRIQDGVSVGRAA